MLRDGLVPGGAKRERYYDTIAEESERLTRLIDNVLEFSRLEQDRRELEMVVGSLEDEVRLAATSWAGRATADCCPCRPWAERLPCFGSTSSRGRSTTY